MVETQTRAHAILSASGAERWIACPPSARLEEDLPDRGSAFSEEGTRAHAFAENELRYWLGLLSQEAYLQNQSAFDNETPGFKADAMRYVQYAIDTIEQVRAATPDAAIMVEERLDFSHVVPEGFGTGDLVIVADGTLWVIDLKFGKGVEVEADDNPQLKLYGIGALGSHGILYDIREVKLVIVQPRLTGEPSVWSTTPEALRQWAQTVVAPAASLAWAGDGAFNPGDHCRFCRAKGTCKARAEDALAVTQYEFREPALLSDEEIAAILEKADRVRKWAADVQEHALKQAEHGHQYPGWKLVRGRSNRKYKDQEAVALALSGAGIPESVIFERSLLGITAMEKAITKKKFNELLGDLVEKPLGKPVLAPASDDRPEIESGAPIDGFEEVPE